MKKVAVEVLPPPKMREFGSKNRYFSNFRPQIIVIRPLLAIIALPLQHEKKKQRFLMVKVYG